MRETVRRVINGALGRVGLRVVHSGWGPRGFAEALRRVKRQGICPEQIVDIGAASKTTPTE